MDDERVAALLDGRLAADERAEAMSRIAADDFESDAFAELVSVLQALDTEHAAAPITATDDASHEVISSARDESSAPDATGLLEDDPPTREATRGEEPPEGTDGVIPIATHLPADAEPGAGEETAAERGHEEPGVISLASRRSSRMPAWRYGALAAGIAAVALGVAVMNRRPSPLDDPSRAVALLDNRSGVAAGWDEPWRGTTRGPAAVADPARAVRLGAQLVDLELAAQVPGDTLVPVISGRVVALLEDTSMAGGAPAASIYREVASRSARREDVRPLLKEGREQLRDLLGSEWFEVGIWAEAARTAAARHDAGFFRSKASRAALERARAIPDMGEPAGTQLDAVRSAIPTTGEPNWPRLEEALTEFLRLAGR